MSIRPIDIQTSVVGSQSASESRSQQQGLEQAHQINPNSEIEEIERKAKEEVNKSEPEAGINPDQEKEQQENEKSDKEAADDPSEQKPEAKKVVSDGIRGRKLDFRV